MKGLENLVKFNRPIDEVTKTDTNDISCYGKWGSRQQLTLSLRLFFVSLTSPSWCGLETSWPALYTPRGPPRIQTVIPPPSSLPSSFHCVARRMMLMGFRSVVLAFEILISPFKLFSPKSHYIDLRYLICPFLVTLRVNLGNNVNVG